MNERTDLESPAGSFGGRFVEEWMRVTGSAAEFRFKLIQDLRRADREKTVRLLRIHAGFSFAWQQRVRQAESPERIARELSREIVHSRNATALMPFLLFGGL
jgi:hypothetical protein